MQDVAPSSALKPSPIPQLLHCMNKHLLKPLFCPLLLLSSPSSVLFSPGWANIGAFANGKLWAEVIKIISLRFFFFVTFSLFPLLALLSFFFLLACSLPAPRVNTSCAPALLHGIKSTHLELALPPQMLAFRLKWAPFLQRGWVKRKIQRGEEGN